MRAPPTQLSLGVRLNDQATFGNFMAVDQDTRYLVTYLKQWVSSPGDALFLFIHGGELTGLSHLLQSVCHRAAEEGFTSQYIPLNEVSGFTPHALLENMEHMSLVCIDDIDVVAGDRDWEEAIFVLFNRLREQGHRLLIGGKTAPNFLQIGLPDLVSRLGSGPVFKLSTLNDEQKLQVLIFRALRRGMELKPDVARFLLNRTGRDMASLIGILDTLDSQTLERQRLLTIPFVKEVLQI